MRESKYRGEKITISKGDRHWEGMVQMSSYEDACMKGASPAVSLRNIQIPSRTSSNVAFASRPNVRASISRSLAGIGTGGLPTMGAEGVVRMTGGVLALLIMPKRMRTSVIVTMMLTTM